MAAVSPAGSSISGTSHPQYQRHSIVFIKNNIVKTLGATLILLAFFTPAFSQEQNKPQEYPWIITDRIYTSDSTAAAILEYYDSKRSIGFISQNGILQKEVPLNGANILGLGKWKGNILCFYTEEKENTRHKDIHAVLVDGKTQTLLTDKVIYANPGNRQLDMAVGNDAAGNFHYLLIRSTDFKAGFMHPVEWFSESIQRTTGLAELQLSDQFQPAVKELSSMGIGGDFMGSFTDAKGQLTLLSFYKDQLIAERFSPEGQLQQTLTTPLDYTPNGIALIKDWIGQLDPANGNILTFNIVHGSRRKYLSLFVFDFETANIVLQQTDELNKDYIRAFKNNPDLTSTRHFQPADDLKPVNIAYTNDKLVVFHEITYELCPPNNGPCALNAEGIIASVYDRQQYHLVHQFFLDRWEETKFEVGRDISCTVRDGKIHVFGCQNISNPIYKYDNFYYVIDPEKNIAERKTPDWGPNPQSDPIDARSIMWFQNCILRVNAGGRLYADSKPHSYLVKVNY
jgi:hypothetical protein